MTPQEEARLTEWLKMSIPDELAMKAADRKKKALERMAIQFGTMPQAAPSQPESTPTPWELLNGNGR